MNLRTSRENRCPTLLAIGALLLVVACAPSAPSPPSAATSPPPLPAATTPPKAAEPPPTAKAELKPAATSAPAAKAAATAAPASKPGDQAAGQAEWDRTLAAARQEGKVVVAGPPGDSYRNATLPFEKAYPGIQLEFVGGLGRDHIPRMLEERRNGVFNWDVYVGGSAAAFDLLAPQALQPVRPSLILPQVLDDSKWFGGFADGYNDKAKQFVYGFLGYLSFHVQVNREFVPESELSSIDQLLDPKWKGKITWQDPRVTGAGATTAGQVLLIKGEEFFRKLLGQEIVPVLDNRQHAEFVVRGRHPIGLGLSSDRVAEFQAQGLGKDIKPLEPRTAAGARYSTGFGTAAVMDRTPRPNAAKVFVNWLLDREAQGLWAKAANVNSRRLDVEGPKDTALYAGMERRTVNDEAYFPVELRARAIAKEIIK